VGVSLRLDVIEMLFESVPVFEALAPDVNDAVGVPETELECEGVNDGVNDGVVLDVADGVCELLGVREPLGVSETVGVPVSERVGDAEVLEVRVGDGEIETVALGVALALAVEVRLAIGTGHALTTTGAPRVLAEQLTRRIRLPSNKFCGHSGTKMAPSARTESSCGDTNDAALPTPSPLVRDKLPASVLTFPSSVIARTKLLLESLMTK
jgi:hypothetical protein